MKIACYSQEQSNTKKSPATFPWLWRWGAPRKSALGTRLSRLGISCVPSNDVLGLISLRTVMAHNYLKLLEVPALAYFLFFLGNCEVIRI